MNQAAVVGPAKSRQNSSGHGVPVAHANQMMKPVRAHTDKAMVPKIKATGGLYYSGQNGRV